MYRDPAHAKVLVAMPIGRCEPELTLQGGRQLLEVDTLDSQDGIDGISLARHVVWSTEYLNEDGLRELYNALWSLTSRHHGGH